MSRFGSVPRLSSGFVTLAGFSPQIVTSLWRALGALFAFGTTPALTADAYEGAASAVMETDRGPFG